MCNSLVFNLRFFHVELVVVSASYRYRKRTKQIRIMGHASCVFATPDRKQFVLKANCGSPNAADAGTRPARPKKIALVSEAGGGLKHTP